MIISVKRFGKIGIIQKRAHKALGKGDQGKRMGKTNIWTDMELAAIVADYFSMLECEMRGEAYSKADHRRALMKLISRSDASIEFKHRNISAALAELGMPWISGYLPAANLQKALYEAIENHVTVREGLLELMPEIEPMPIRQDFEPTPPLRRNLERPEFIRRLVRKFDPGDRDLRNRKLGKAGEEWVLGFERRRLEHLGRPDLAREIRWVSQLDGDGAGFDVLSFDARGAERLVEVKTTCGNSTTPFFITRNECRLAEERPEDFRVYRVFEYGRQPRVFQLTPPLTDVVHLEASCYQASF